MITTGTKALAGAHIQIGIWESFRPKLQSEQQQKQHMAVENAARAELGSKDQMWRIIMFSISNIRQATHSIEEDHKNTVFQKIVQNSVRYQRAT